MSERNQTSTDGAPTSAKPPGIGRNRRSTARQRRVITLAAAGVVVIAAITIAIAVSGPSGPAFKLAATLTNPSGWKTDSVAISPDGKMLVISDEDGHAYFWNTTTHRLIATLPDPGRNRYAQVAFSPNGKLLAFAGVGGSFLMDVATRRVTSTLSDPGGQGTDFVAFSPNGKILAAADQNDNTYLWDITTRHLIGTVAGSGSKEIFTLAFSSDSAMLAVGDDNGKTYVWNTTTGHLIATLTDPDNLPYNVSAVFSPDGKTLDTYDGDFNAYAWDTATWQRTAMQQGILTLRYSADGKLMATGDPSGNTNIRKMFNGPVVATLKGHGVAFAVSANGKVIITVPVTASKKTFLWIER